MSNRESLDSTSWAASDRIKDLDVALWVLVADQQPRLPGCRRRRKVHCGLAGRAASAGRTVQRQQPRHRGRADDLIWQWRLDLVLSMVIDALAP